ncbi:hypothetical protein VII00023_20732 [Vibrio ichthyoenteri ATCC 700023]|uniref:Uncharacterized protein n=1 Tax=Vibrio ichthyoenteri ATCC 700023 TaxID=870968 RepID=F9S7V9_9VIBR|nr:major coat protein [Vibrio ichthyoenteri]EGU31009.1 hypothetical protein VII00023_20732 [Vibrio ichthyoenteri ATCC 700023]
MKVQNVTKATLIVGALLGSATASAALPAEAEAAFTAVSTFATDVIAAAWPIVTLLTVGFIGMKLFKKAANKAS